MDEGIKECAAMYKTSLIMNIINRKTTVSEASLDYQLISYKIEEWVEGGIKEIQNNPRIKTLETKEDYIMHLHEMQVPP